MLPQILRSAISVPSNIAEGNARLHAGDYIHHAAIARGSLAELETQLEITVRRKYLQRNDVIPAFASTSAVGKVLNGLIESLKARR